MKIAIISVGVVIIIGLGVFFMLDKDPETVTPANQSTGTQTNQAYTNQTQPVNTGYTNDASTASAVQWQNTQNGWVATGTPPACPTPLFASPVELTDVTAILYPGQTRGEYKPHGGFRFDNATTTAVSITAPADAEIVRGGRYLINGEVQYTFDFIMPCGMMYRLGHLLVLTPKFQAIVDTFPAAQEMDSRTTNVNPYVNVTAGEEIATAVGVTKGGLNVFFDFGVYDLTKKNAASQNASYAASHDLELAQHAVCWFDYLPAADETRIRSLPAGDPTAGKTSDYCL